MNTFLIIILTLTVYWIIGAILMFVTKENEKIIGLYAMGLIYPLLYIIVRPIVLLKNYIKEKIKHGKET